MINTYIKSGQFKHIVVDVQAEELDRLLWDIYCHKNVTESFTDFKRKVLIPPMTKTQAMHLAMQVWQECSKIGG